MTVIWTAPTIERIRPDQPLAEREALEGWLDFHRDTLLVKCAGLTADHLKQRSVPPSSLSLLGLVRHMTQTERQWFRINGADQEMGFPYSTWDDEDADFDNVDTADAQADLAAFRREIEAVRAEMRGKQLNDVVHTHIPPGKRRDIRWIYLHMIEEYARHNGHADLVRERIDGATGQ